MTERPGTLPSDIRGLLLDLDGVVYHGDIVIPQAPPFFRFLRERGIPFLLTTNNSTMSSADYVQKLERMDIHVHDYEVLGSAEATGLYLQQQSSPGARAFVIGESGLRNAVEKAGLILAETDVEYVIVGLDRQVDYRKLTLAVNLVRGGATFIGPNPDTTLPMPVGVIPGAGSFQALITAASGRKPTIIGKPEPTMLAMGADRLSLPVAQVAMVGDRLDTDVLGANRAGMPCIMVLTGVSSRADLTTSPAQPGLVLEDLAELQALLAQT
ncbi:MAG: HAD-IIA family hydrolase [Chloroflexota bacterium]